MTRMWLSSLCASPEPQQQQQPQQRQQLAWKQTTHVASRASSSAAVGAGKSRFTWPEGGVGRGAGAHLGAEAARREEIGQLRVDVHEGAHEVADLPSERGGEESGTWPHWPSQTLSSLLGGLLSSLSPPPSSP